MNRIILFVFLITTCSGFGQLSEEQLISAALSQLEITRSEAFSRHITLEKFDDESLLVIPGISEEGEGYIIFDANLVLVENKTGKIISKYFGEQDWYSDAVTLTNMEIEPEIYRLNESDPAYGLRINYSGRSTPNPYNATELSLYVKQGEQLKQVLKDFRISYLNAETDLDCNREFVTHSKSLEIMNSKTKGFFDLKITDSIEKSVSTDLNCELKVVDNSRQIEVLKFDGENYKP